MGGMIVKRCEWEQKGKKRVDGIQYWRVKCPYCGSETAVRFRPFPCEKKVCSCGAYFLGGYAYSPEKRGR